MALAVLLGQRVIFMVGTQTVNVLIGLVCLINGGLLDVNTLIRFGSNAVGISVFQIAGALFYRQLEQVATAAERDQQVGQEAGRAGCHGHPAGGRPCAAIRAIEATIVPLLGALADGTADCSRMRCAGLL